MTDTEALQNQFHDELHQTNLKILDVSTNLASLSGRVDAISDSNAEVNKNINNFALILDDHSTRIKDLEGQTRRTAKEVAVRAAKSVTRSIEQSEIQEIHEEIHEVALAVDNLDANLEPRVRHLENDTAELQRQVVALHLEDSSIWDAMIDMDVEHHEELHKLALAIDNHESRIDSIEHVVYEYNDRIDDVEREINDVSTNINNLIIRVDEIENIVNDIPPHIVLTKEEYDDLDNPDYNSFYFTYEDEE